MLQRQRRRRWQSSYSIHICLCFTSAERLEQTHLMWPSPTTEEASEVSFAYTLEAAPLRAAKEMIIWENFMMFGDRVDDID